MARNNHSFDISYQAFNDADRKRILDSLTEDDLATLKEAFTVYEFL